MLTKDSGLRENNYSRIDTTELLPVLMQTMDRQTINMQRVHHVLLVAFHLLMSSCN